MKAFAWVRRCVAERCGVWLASDGSGEFQRRVMCESHWAMVPVEQQRRILKTFGGGWFEWVAEVEVAIGIIRDAEAFEYAALDERVTDDTIHFSPSDEGPKQEVRARRKRQAAVEIPSLF